MRIHLSFLLFSLLAACTNPGGADGLRDPAPADPTIQVVLKSQVQFDQLNPARGDQSPKAGTLWGDRKGRAATGFLFNPVDGFQSPPHIHNVSYRGVVIRGLVHNDDPKADDLWMPAGSFWTQPKGGIHITAAKGEDTLAYIEIDEGPYLVQPVADAFGSEERPLNVHASNLVWVDHPAATTATDQRPQLAFLWGRQKIGELSGTLVRLPGGFEGSMRSSSGGLRAVVIAGQLVHQAASEGLEPGSYFHSPGAAVHRIRCDAGEGCTLYVRTRGSIAFLPSRSAN